MLWFPWRLVGISGLSLRFFFLFSSSSLVRIWIRLEFNFFCFVPLIAAFQRTRSRERESVTLYFLFQGFFSLVFLMGFFFFYYHMRELGPLLIFLSVVGKMGGFPFYFWVPPVVAPLRYESTWILLRVQKLGPIALYLSFINTFSGDLIFFSVVIRFFVRAVGGFNQRWLRPFMAFSSIAQRGWFIIRGLGGIELFIAYFLIYAVRLKLLLNLADHHIGFLFFSPYKNWQGGWSPKVVFVLVFFSLGGLPPFPGFFIKFLVIWFLSSFLRGFKIIIIRVIAGLTLFFYCWYSLKGLLINNIAFLFTRVVPSGYTYLGLYLFFSFSSWLLLFRI